jgi:hypothetical protein
MALLLFADVATSVPDGSSKLQELRRHAAVADKNLPALTTLPSSGLQSATSNCIACETQ